MSDMARIPLELELRADANWFHGARRTTGINNRQTGPQHDKRNCKRNLDPPDQNHPHNPYRLQHFYFLFAILAVCRH
jgi:hypothetical protein